MLTDNDRNIRRQGLEGIRKSLNEEKDNKIAEFFYRERLSKRLVITLEDQIEKNRELAIDIIQKMTERVGLKDESQILLPAIAARMNNTPFPEQSEETRLLLIDLLQVCLQSDKYQFLPKLGEICSMLSKAATDPNPEMKQKSAKFGAELCKELKDKVGGYMRNTVASLVKNLHHQHSKVRKSTLLGLQDILVCRGSEQWVEEALPQLKYSINDRSQDVRQTFYHQVLRHWVTNMEIHSLRKYEHHFVLFLLNGTADEIPEISKACTDMLEDHGKNMHDALVQMGEEEEKMSVDGGSN